MDKIMMKQCSDCHGIGDFNDSLCCGGNIAADGTCFVCGFKTKRDLCLRCGGTGEIPDETDEYERERIEAEMEADSYYSQYLLDKYDL